MVEVFIAHPPHTHTHTLFGDFGLDLWSRTICSWTICSRTLDHKKSKVMLSGVTPMGSGWANPRAPGLRVPLHAFQLILLFHKGAPFQHFPIVWLRNSHNDAFHKLIKWQNYLGALSKGRGGWGSNFTYVSYNTWMCRPNGWILHKKNL